MKLFDVDQFQGGWFVGAFPETAYLTNDCEVAYKTHSAGERWDTHYHQIATEINYLISGSMSINDRVFEAPIVFVIEPGEIAQPTFLTDVSLVVVKVPSVLGDKYIVDDFQSK